MNTKIKDTRSEQSSHCLCCGTITRPSVKIGDVSTNNEFCNFCAPLAAKVINALFRVQLSSKELMQCVEDRLPAGIIANRSVMSKKESIEAQRAIKVAIDSLAARQEEMRSKIDQQTKLN